MDYNLSFANVSALVIGDVMLDVFLYGKSSRLSPEAPVPVVLIDHETPILGGAANVAANLHSLGAKVDICGFIGDNDRKIEFVSLLESTNIVNHLVPCENAKTITKTRVVSNGQHLLRFDKESPADFANYEGLESKLRELGASGKYDFVIISDYDKGVINANTIQVIKDSFAKIPIFVDPRPKNFALYKDTFCITPNLSEARAMLNDNISSVEQLAINMKKLLNVEAVAITLSEKGVLLLDTHNDIYHIDAYQLQVKERLHRLDVSGAGDTLIGTLAASLKLGYDMLESTVIANVSAAIVVNKLGTAVCEIDELNKEIKEIDSIVKGLRNGKKVDS